MSCCWKRRRRIGGGTGGAIAFCGCFIATHFFFIIFLAFSYSTTTIAYAAAVHKICHVVTRKIFVVGYYYCASIYLRIIISRQWHWLYRIIIVFLRCIIHNSFCYNSIFSIHRPTWMISVMNETLTVYGKDYGDVL